MITSGIFYALYAVIVLITLPIRALPDATLPADFSNAIANASSALSSLNVVIPVSSLAAIIALFIIIEGTIFTYKIIRWVYQKIPGIN